MTGNIVALGNAVTSSSRKAQMIEHFGRKLDAVLSDGAGELSVLFVVYGHKPAHISNVVSWDIAESGAVPIRMMLTDAAALMLDEARQMRPPTSHTGEG